jgi:uncharacterized protein YbjQ (UPF0145 family)
MIVVTTFDLPGYEVMGMTVRSANIGANFVAGFRSMGGGEITEFTKIVYESRQEVMHRMVTEAERRGANAVVAMRFDTGSIGQNFTEVCAYGTAVVVSPFPAGQPGATKQSAQLAGGGPAKAPMGPEHGPSHNQPMGQGQPMGHPTASGPSMAPGQPLG